MNQRFFSSNLPLLHNPALIAQVWEDFTKERPLAAGPGNTPELLGVWLDPVTEDKFLEVRLGPGTILQYKDRRRYVGARFALLGEVRTATPIPEPHPKHVPAHLSRITHPAMLHACLKLVNETTVIAPPSAVRGWEGDPSDTNNRKSVLFDVAHGDRIQQYRIRCELVNSFPNPYPTNEGPSQSSTGG